MGNVNPVTIFKVIEKHQRFLITTHVNPDPDALCSEMAMAIFLRSLKKKVVILNHEAVPNRFGFLPSVQKIKSCDGGGEVEFDAAIVVDCGDLNRVGKVKSLIENSKVVINIDHHITNDGFGHFNLVHPEASSTAEVLYDLFKAAKFSLTRDLAMHLYIGIMTDTGSFRYENTSARTHAIVSELMAFSFSPSELYKKFYESIPFSDLKEFTRVISRFDVYLGGRVVCLNLTKRVLAKFSEDFDLRDAIFKFLRSIKNVEVFAIFTELESQKTRVNLRSIQRIDVAQLANEFHGGGHRRASGCVINEPALIAREMILKKIERCYRQRGARAKKESS